MVRIDNNFNFQTVPSYRDSLTSVNSVQDKYKTRKEIEEGAVNYEEAYLD